MSIGTRINVEMAEWADAGDDVPEELKIIRELRDTREDLAACLALYVAEYRAFRTGTVGCPNSEVRQEQERRILIENRAKAILERAEA